MTAMDALGCYGSGTLLLIAGLCLGKALNGRAEGSAEPDEDSGLEILDQRANAPFRAEPAMRVSARRDDNLIADLDCPEAWAPHFAEWADAAGRRAHRGARKLRRNDWDDES